jgi:hypothetical protein
VAGISKHNGSNIAGVRSITLLELDGVSTTADGLKIPIPIDGEISANLTVAAGSQHPIFIMESQATLRSQQTETAAGRQFQSTLVCFTPATRQAATETLKLLHAQHLLVLMTDENGQQRLMGNDEQRVTMQANEVQIEGRNGYEITLTFNSSSPVPWYSGVLS